MSSARPIAYLLALTSLACEPETAARASQPSGSSSGTAGGTNPVGCPPNDICSANPPGGWDGFLLVVESDLECASGWHELAQGVLAPVVAPSAQCSSCACGEPEVQCGPAMVETSAGNDCNSGELNGTFTLTPDACTPISSPDLDGLRALPIPVQSASCEPSGGRAEVPPLSSGPRAKLCTPDNAPSCDEGRCIDALAGPRCMAAAGEQHACPTGFPVRHVLVEAVADTRGCTPCECAPPSATCEGVSTVSFTMPDCSGPSFLNPHNGVCTPTGFDMVNGSVFLEQAVVVSSCAPSGGEPTGAVEVLAHTVCCEAAE